MRFIVFLSLSLTVHASMVLGSDWGNLTMRFVYDGDAPRPQEGNSDVRGVAPESPLGINDQDRGIRNVCVWLSPTKGETVPIHPDANVSGSVQMTVFAAQFKPRICLVNTKQTLTIRNAETSGYDLVANSIDNKPFNILLRAGDTITRTFNATERFPIQLRCSIRPLLGYVVVRDNPYTAISDEHGLLKMTNVPVGDWSFTFWHESSGVLKKAVRANMPFVLTKGRSVIAIKATDNDLGEIRLAHEQIK